MKVDQWVDCCVMETAQADVIPLIDRERLESAGTFRNPEVLAVVEQFSQALPLTVAQIRDAVIGGEPENLRWQLIQPRVLSVLSPTRH